MSVKVSFILPAYNAEATIKEALDSLSAQTFDDFEVLVFDDGSSDSTASIVNEASKNDSRIKLVGNKKVGLIEALNQSIDISKAPYIARMDADDICRPTRLEKQVQFLDSNPDISLVSCKIHCFPDSLVENGMRRYEDWLNTLITPDQIATDIFVESPLCHPSVTMRRQAFDLTGGYIDDGNPEDYGLWLRFWKNDLKMAKVPEVLFDWQESEYRLTRTHDRYTKPRFLELKAGHIIDKYLNENKSVIIWGAGQNGRTWSRYLEKHGIKITAFVDVDKKKIGKTIHSAPVISHNGLETADASSFLIAAVGSQGAREKIRSFLKEKNWIEHRDFICVE